MKKNIVIFSFYFVLGGAAIAAKKFSTLSTVLGYQVTELSNDLPR
jgi:hypothetical protein